MKKFLKHLTEFISILKTGAMTLGALYLVFWFYRFFELPFVDILCKFFDFPNNFIVFPIETMSMYKGHIVQNAYFIYGIICAVISFIFSLLEKLSYELQRRYDMYDVSQKHKLEENINKELEQEYTQDVRKYCFFSIYIKYKLNYISDVLSSSNPYTTEGITTRSYDSTFDFIKKNLPFVFVKQNKDSIFLYTSKFDLFESVIEKILYSIKQNKKNNTNAYMDTDFLIVCDAQKSEASAANSYSELVRIANFEYYNRAVVTTTFKTRFELLKSEKFVVDILGFASGGRKDTALDSDIYILKPKPKQV